MPLSLTCSLCCFRLILHTRMLKCSTQIDKLYRGYGGESGVPCVRDHPTGGTLTRELQFVPVFPELVVNGSSGLLPCPPSVDPIFGIRSLLSTKRTGDAAFNNQFSAGKAADSVLPFGSKGQPCPLNSKSQVLPARWL